MKKLFIVMLTLLTFLTACSKHQVTKSLENPSIENPNTPPKVKSVSAGGSHSMILKEDGTLWATGNNKYGQLGTGDMVSISKPVQVATEVASVSAGKDHTVIVKKDGTVWGTGSGFYGQLGMSPSVSEFTKLKDDQGKDIVDVKSVSATGGFGHTMILTNSGDLLASGHGMYGELGIGTPLMSKYSFTKVASGVASVSVGYEQTLIVKIDGTLWATGNSGSGRLGFTPNGRIAEFTKVVGVSSVSSVSSGEEYTLIVKADGSVHGAGRIGTSSLPVFTPSGQSGIAIVSAGKEHRMLLKKDGTLLGAGVNTDGRVGMDGVTTVTTVAEIMKDVSSVSAGSTHTMIVKKDGTLWATGANSSGQLGTGNTTEVKTPVQVIF